MFDSIIKFFKKFSKDEKKDSKDTAKERLHLVLMQDRANVSADFMELMKQEIIEVIKKYVNVDENSIDVKLTNKVNSDGTTGAPILYANIPILNVKDDTKQINIERKLEKSENKETKKDDEKSEKIENKTTKKEETIIEDEAEKREEVVETTNEEEKESETLEDTVEVTEDSEKKDETEKKTIGETKKTKKTDKKDEKEEKVEVE